jgi:hypothetical protein
MELPESPPWLVYKGMDAEAISVLAAREEDDIKVRTEYLAIKESVEDSSNASFKDLFTMDKHRYFHCVVLGYVNQMFRKSPESTWCVQLNPLPCMYTVA